MERGRWLLPTLGPQEACDKESLDWTRTFLLASTIPCSVLIYFAPFLYFDLITFLIEGTIAAGSWCKVKHKQKKMLAAGTEKIPIAYLLPGGKQ